jgi:hypothetical protein
VGADAVSRYRLVDDAAEFYGLARTHLHEARMANERFAEARRDDDRQFWTVMCFTNLLMAADNREAARRIRREA